MARFIVTHTYTHPTLTKNKILSQCLISTIIEHVATRYSVEFSKDVVFASHIFVRASLFATVHESSLAFSLKTGYCRAQFHYCLLLPLRKPWLLLKKILLSHSPRFRRLQGHQRQRIPMGNYFRPVWQL